MQAAPWPTAAGGLPAVTASLSALPCAEHVTGAFANECVSLSVPRD